MFFPTRRLHNTASEVCLAVVLIQRLPSLGRPYGLWTRTMRTVSTVLSGILEGYASCCCHGEIKCYARVVKYAPPDRTVD